MINQSENQHLTDEEDSIDLKQIVAGIFNHWYLFAIGMAVCLFAAVLYAHYSPSVWNVESKILVEDPKNSPSSMAGTSGMGADFGSIFNVKSSADNEIQILKSRSLMDSVVKQLQLNVRIYRINGLKAVEIYQEAPFLIKLNYKADTLITRKYLVGFQKNGQYKLSNSKDSTILIAKPGTEVKLKQYNLVLNLVPGHQLKGGYAVFIESPDATVDALRQNFTVGLSDKQSTAIDLSLNYPHPKKGEVILEELMDLYLLSNLQNKVKTADNTIAFINSRIALVGNELNDIELQFEQYKTQQNISDISAQSKELVSSASEYYDKLNQDETQLSIFNELAKILNNPDNKALIPSSMVAPGDIGFGQGVSAYNQLLIEKDKAGLAYTAGNPVIQNYNKQIETARQTLLASIAAYKRNLETAKSMLQKQNSKLSDRLQQVPAKERGYLDFQRKQGLKQDLYLYLLQKREETAVSKTSTISSSRIIDHAKSAFSPYSPKKPIIYFAGILLGLIIPGLYLSVKALLNIKVNSKEDIIRGTSVPVAGEIGHNPVKGNLAVINNPRSVVSEQFRNIRTKLNYLIDINKPNVILFTSSMSGEGKSFISLNLGSSLALTGKKVIFMELDLRKPKLSELIGDDHAVSGYTNYIASGLTDINQLIKKTRLGENCSLISSGPVPPNPAELLMHEKLAVLINELKERFDYIIIDCAPIGLVTDALLVEKYADLTFYIIREKYTYKSQLNIINELKDNNEVKKLYLIYNDIKTKNGGYGYGGYGYGGYGYGIEKKEGWIKRFLKLN